jgi:predicted NBD/HSP70 family sugar kinase
LQRSTISAIVDSLKAEGLVKEVGEGESTGGRRPTLLRLRTAGPIAVGVSITPTRTIVATSDLAGRVIEQEEFLTDPIWNLSAQRIIASVKHFSNQPNSSIEAVGISIPGLADPETGCAIYVPYFKWRDLPIEQIISDGTGLPVIIDNDANSVGLAELWFGRPEISDARDFILILVAEGVGSGIIIDGQV